MPDGTVHGVVMNQNGIPLPDYTVKAYDQDLASEHQLGIDATTDDRGEYSISYVESEYTQSETKGPDLFLRVYDTESQLVATTDIIFNVSEDVIVPITVGREQSEYEQVEGRIMPSLDDLPPEILTPDHAVFLHNDTGVDLAQIDAYRHAARLAVEAHPDVFTQLNPSDPTYTLAPEAFYALVRAGLPDDLHELFQRPLLDLIETIDGAIANNIVRPDFYEPEGRPSLDLRLQEHVRPDFFLAAKRKNNPGAGFLLQKRPVFTPRVFLVQATT